MFNVEQRLEPKVFLIAAEPEGLRGGSVVVRDLVEPVTARRLAPKSDVELPGRFPGKVHGQLLHGLLHILVEECGPEDEKGGVPENLVQLLVDGSDLVSPGDVFDGGEDGFSGGPSGDHHVGGVAGGGVGQEADPVAKVLLVHQATVDPGVPLQDEVPGGLVGGGDPALPRQEPGPQAYVLSRVQLSTLHAHFPRDQQAFNHPGKIHRKFQREKSGKKFV